MVGAALDLEDFAALGARPVVTIEKIKHCCQTSIRLLSLDLGKITYLIQDGCLRS